MEYLEAWRAFCFEYFLYITALRQEMHAPHEQVEPILQEAKEMALILMGTSSAIKKGQAADALTKLAARMEVLGRAVLSYDTRRVEDDITSCVIGAESAWTMEEWHERWEKRIKDRG